MTFRSAVRTWFQRRSLVRLSRSLIGERGSWRMKHAIGRALYSLPALGRLIEAFL
jgi:hypothetical protein